MTDAERLELARLQRIQADELKTPILRLAESAWDAVRKLTMLAEKYATGAKVHEGDYPPEGFAEKVFELAQIAPKGLNAVIGDRTLVGTTTEDELRAAAHEDTHIPSPNPEDFDPLKSDLAEPPTPNRRSLVPDRRGLFPGGKPDSRPDTTVERREGTTDRRGLTK
jgi:hypothetical protein